MHAFCGRGARSGCKNRAKSTRMRAIFAKIPKVSAEFLRAQCEAGARPHCKHVACAIQHTKVACACIRRSRRAFWTQKPRKINADARDFCENSEGFGRVFARATRSRRTFALQTCRTCRAACRHDFCMHCAVAARVLDAKSAQNQRGRARFVRKFRGSRPSFCARNAQQAHARSSNMSHVPCSVLA